MDHEVRSLKREIKKTKENYSLGIENFIHFVR
jgi:hypothetical protein